MAEVTKIPAGELQVGDHYAASKSAALDGQHTPITEIRDGQTSRSITLEGGNRIRPRRTTEVWVMLENGDDRLAGAASPDEMDGERPPTETSASAAPIGGEASGDQPSTDEQLAELRAALKGKRGIDIDTVELDGEQTIRAIEVEAGGQAGLTGKALKTYILTGSSGAKEAQAAREASTGRHTPRGPKEGSMTSAMLQVMKPLRTPATAKEVTKKILERNLAPGLKGKTPEATVGAKLSTEAAKPNGLFERVAPGQYQVRDGGSQAGRGRARQATK